VRDAILKLMKSHRFFVQHPAETRPDGTKYVAAFRGKNGRVVAFDKAVATKFPMWMLDETLMRELLDRLGVPYDCYPPERGRNSNLKKLAEFKSEALLRVFPQDEIEAETIIKGVTELPLPGC